MQKPILWLYLVIVASLSIHDGMDTFMKYSKITGGVHPKNAFLLVSCPDPYTAYVGQTCNVSLKVPVPQSNCTITSMAYRLNPALPWTNIPNPNTVDSVLIGNYGVTTLNVFFQVTDACTPAAQNCMLAVTVRDTIRPVILCPPDITAGNNPDDGRSFPVLVPPPLLESDNCDVDYVVNSHNNTDDASGSYPLGTTTVIWTIADIHGNTSTCAMTVTVVDDTPPVITCPPNLSLQCSGIPPYTNYAAFEAAGGDASDDIRLDTLSFVLLSETSNAPAFPLTITRTYAISDTAGNQSTCVHTVQIRDDFTPVFECSGLKKISLSEVNQIAAIEFLTSGPTDNCGGVPVVSVRRMDTDCDPAGNQFGPYVSFCCADVGKTIMVEVRVTDSNGVSNTCMVGVEVQDKLPPAIIIPLPDISLSCAFALDTANLSGFGTYVSNGAPRSNIVINDPGNPFYPSGIAGQDGVYSDNCPGASVQVRVRNQLNMCNFGKIYRDFTITDVGGNSTTITQTIHVINHQPFGLSNITWPVHEVFYPHCNVNPPNPDSTGRPQLLINRCAQAGATFSDQVFPHPSYCRYVRRTWTVIDWCQYQTNNPGGPGKWTFVQHIYVTNNVAPVISAATCRDTTICAQGASCIAQVLLTAAGTDDCMPQQISWSYRVDYGNNGSFEVNANGNSFSSLVERGTHRIVWQAKDGCGNTSTCTRIFTVKECKPPTPIALFGLVTNLTNPGPSSKVWASDFNNFSSDNCTPAGKLRFSFSSDVNDHTRMFDCSKLGRQDLQLWVTDEDGNQAFTWTYIIVQDNHQLCGNMPRVSIQGSIGTEDGVMLNDTKISLTGGETRKQCATNEEGKYFFKELGMYNTYEISPELKRKASEGVSTLDLVLIQRHILGLQKLDSPYKIIAADANNSGTVTSSDLVEIRKVILGQRDSFAHAPAWKFVESSYRFADPSHPWPHPAIITYDNLDSDMTQSDFTAIKTGDVNNSVNEFLGVPNTENRTDGKIDLTADDIFLKEGELVSIPLRIREDALLQGLQWTMVYSDKLEFSGFESKSLPMKADNLAVISRDRLNYLTVSWHQLAPLKLAAEDELIHLVFLVRSSDRLSKNLYVCNDIARSEAYDPDDRIMDLRLSFRAANFGSQASVTQNQPNPFREETTIGLQLPSRNQVVLSIFDSEGKLVHKSSAEYPAGNHRIVINDKILAQRTGVFYCKIKAGDLNEVVRIMRIE